MRILISLVLAAVVTWFAYSIVNGVVTDLVADESVPDIVSQTTPGQSDIVTIDGGMFQRSGSVLYMLDGNKQRITAGYHSFERIRKDVWIARLGSKAYLIADDGTVMSEGYFTIEVDGENYLATDATREYRLGKDGKPIKGYPI